MSDLYKYRNLFLLGLFLVLAMSGPLAFAQQDGLERLNQGEASAHVFVRFKDVSMHFRDGNDISQQKAMLGPGSVIQIPSTVAKFNQDGTINLNRTMEYWLEFAQLQKQHQGYSHFSAQDWNCQNRGKSVGADGKCDGVTDGELFFPVKVVKSSDNKLNVNSDDAYGYLALDYIRNNITPDRYETVHTTLENALQFTDENSLPLPDTLVVGGDSSFEGGSSETTSQVTSARPTARPQEQTVARSPVINCDNTIYRSSNWAAHSCLKNMSIVQRAELVMRDVLATNAARPAFKLDPRFSVCVAYRESGLHPNAKGGTPDWGMYQVIDATGRGALRRNNPVTQGFSQFRYNWNQYRDNMLKSTLAQADLHHSVLFEKAKENGLAPRINSGTTDTSVYQTLATRYNGAGARARTYGRKVAACYEAMKSVADRNGRITRASGLQAALNRAK